MNPTLSVSTRVLSLTRDRCVLAFVNSIKICGEWDGLTRVISVPSWAAAWVSRHSTYKSCSCHLAASSSFVKLSNCCWVSFMRLGCLGECGLLGFPPLLLLWGLLGEDGPADLTSLHSSAISTANLQLKRTRGLYAKSSVHQCYDTDESRHWLNITDAIDIRRQPSETETYSATSIKLDIQIIRL